MSTTSLWPDFKTETKPRGMKQILLDAGGDLTEKTNGLVQFVVEVRQTDQGFSYSCYLAVRGTQYKIEVLSIETEHASFPAVLYTPTGSEIAAIRSEADLRSQLAKIFQAEETKQIVLNLMANFG